VLRTNFATALLARTASVFDIERLESADAGIGDEVVVGGFDTAACLSKGWSDTRGLNNSLRSGEVTFCVSDATRGCPV